MDEAVIVVYGADENPRHIVRIRVEPDRADSVADALHEMLVDILKKVTVPEPSAPAVAE